MTNIFCYILLSFSVVFLLAVIIGKAGKDEPLKPPIEEWEDVYTNPKYNRWER